MKIIFSNNKEFEYTQAFAIEKDHYNGETRPSIEVHLPVAQTSFDEICAIVTDADIMQSFTLVGDAPAPIPVYMTQEVQKEMTYEDGKPILNEEGNPIVMTFTETVVDENGEPIIDYYQQAEPPMNTYEGFVFGDRITVEKGVLVFKKYKASESEIENVELKAAVDTLLIAMEV